MKPVLNCETIEIVLDSAKREYKLIDARQIEGKKIYGIETYKIGSIPLSPLGATLAADATVIQGFLDLQNKDSKVIIKNLPLARLISSVNDIPIDFDGIEIDPSKSVLRIPGAVAITSAHVILLTFYFT